MESLSYSLLKSAMGELKQGPVPMAVLECAYMEHDDATSLTALTEAIDFDHHHDRCQAEA